MSESKNFSADDWLQAQKTYWDAWMDMSRKAMSQPGAPAWSDAVDQWWKIAGGNLPEATRPYAQPMMDIGRSFFTTAEKLFQGASADNGNPMNAVNQWLDQMTQGFQAMSVGQAPGKDLNAFWKMPMDTWNRVVSNFMPMPGDFMQALRPEMPYGDAAKEQMDRFLSVPGVGYTRESQEQYQHLGKLILDYQQASQQYQTAFAQVGLDTIERFRARLEDIAEKETPINSARGFYDVWVDVAEEVYGEFAMSEEYARVYGEMINRLMAVKKHGSTITDEVAESLNMPTRREVNTLHERLQESRREMFRMKSQLHKLTKAQKTAASASSSTTPAASKPAASKPASSSAGSGSKSSTTSAQKPAAKG